MQTRIKQNTGARNPAKNARATGRRAKPKNQPAQPDGSRQRAGGAGELCGPGIHVLAGALQSLSYGEAYFKFGLKNGYSEQPIMQIVNTPALQLQAIEDFYNIVIAQPCYAKLKHPQWRETDSPFKVLNYYLRKMGRLTKGRPWHADTWQDGEGKTRFRFVVKEYFKDISGYLEYIMPIDFLPQLKQRDSALHDIVLHLLALVAKTCHLPLWDADGDFSEAIKYLISAADPANKTPLLLGEMDLAEDWSISRTEKRPYSNRHNRYLLNHEVKLLEHVDADRNSNALWRNGRVLAQRENYRHGPAAYYLQHMKALGATVTIKSVEELVYSYGNWGTKIKQRILWWVKAGVELAKKGGNLQQFTYLYNYKGHPDKAITPYRNYKFVWSTHPADFVQVWAANRVTKDKNAGGLKYAPVKYSIAKPGEALKPLTSSDFPNKLSLWLDEMRKLLNNKSSATYFGTWPDGPLTPAERFIKQIEEAEIKNTKL